MKPLAAALARTFLAALAPLLPLAAAAPAGALVQGSYTMEILVDGRPLPELAGRGRTYVEATAGREYSIRLTNHTGRRVAIALAVDGLNSIDAKTTAARDGSKWILGPWESVTLDGWQTSSKVARRFYFTSETASYGAWLGKTDNLGVISAAVFRERLPEPAPILEQRLEGGASGARRESGAAPAPQSKSAAPAPSGQADSALSDDYAATGIGREVDHRVERVRFDAEPAPAACLEVRYEYRDALVKLGLLPRVRPASPLDRREHAHGFAEPGFAPDPYRQHPRGE